MSESEPAVEKGQDHDRLRRLAGLGIEQRHLGQRFEREGKIPLFECLGQCLTDVGLGCDILFQGAGRPAQPEPDEWQDILVLRCPAAPQAVPIERFGLCVLTGRVRGISQTAE